jgi:hypothetical protein
LASLGVGTLALLDPEVLAADNVHRHALGVCDVGFNKSAAVAVDLRTAFPHQRVTAHPSTLDDMLRGEITPLAGMNLHVFALGDETLERRLNLTLSQEVPALHVWTEPLGIGGHAVLVCPRQVGCFECLFDTDETWGPYNSAALTQPGQTIHRSMAGCVGIFTPFSILDATQAALEGSRLAARFLAGSLKESQLVSWRGNRTEFEASNLRLSVRGRVIAPGQRTEVTGSSFWRRSCSRCRSIVGRL